jgi:hypothetical protein
MRFRRQTRAGSLDDIEKVPHAEIGQQSTVDMLECGFDSRRTSPGRAGDRNDRVLL